MGTTILFGGTFDPVHHGHLITAQAARETLRADVCLFIPARISPHKVSTPTSSDPDAATLSAAHRLAMLQLAIAGAPGLAVDDLELTRPGPSYTFDTVSQLLARRPTERLILLLGSDQLPRFHTWHRVTELLNCVDLGLLERPGAPLSPGLQHIATHLGPATAERLRAALLPTPLIDLSATTIRQRVAAGRSIRYLVPDAVAAYIAAQQIYRAPGA